MKMYILCLALFSSLYSYDSRVIGMGGVSTTSLGINGGGQNPASVDINNFDFTFVGGIGSGIELGEYFKVNIFASLDVPNIFTTHTDSNAGVNIRLGSQNNSLILGYSNQVRISGFKTTIKDKGEIIALKSKSQLFDSTHLNIGFVYGYYPQSSKLYRAGASITSDFSWLNATIGYEKIVSDSEYFDSNQEGIGVEIGDIFTTPFAIEGGIVSKENTLYYSKGIYYHYQKNKNSSSEFVLQMMQLPIKFTLLPYALYEVILTFGASHYLGSYIFSENKFDSIRIGIASDNNDQACVTFEYGINF